MRTQRYPTAVPPSLGQRFRLEDRVAIVTAAGGGLGAVIAHTLAEAGARVVVASCDEAKAESVVKEIRSLGYDSCAAVLDMSDQTSIEAMLGDVCANYGRLDVLVNCAESDVPGHISDYSVDDWRTAMEIDSSGWFCLTRGAAETMVESRKGAIVNVSSVLGMRSADPRLHPDGTSEMRPTHFFAKAGMLNFSRFLAVEYAEWGVRVNSVSPGGVATSPPRQTETRFTDRVPMHRLADPQEVADGVLYLCTDAASYVTGQNLAIDGGYTAW